MNWLRIRAALIRAFWAFVFPMLGSLVLYFGSPEVLEELGITNAVIIAAVSSALYGLKKLFWPDTVI